MRSRGRKDNRAAIIIHITKVVMAAWEKGKRETRGTIMAVVDPVFTTFNLNPLEKLEPGLKILPTFPLLF
ncbi:hypothetical protein L2E82_19759 [Cichorium intybus]|uniref:Uncharacterized protein n=1 Tax=Cichorium intybus TaxID=13427 RepID=A0ACB9DRG0_CICIN|nr:hypothetical protein L2E82_19759 [Cichorium intybus]